MNDIHEFITLIKDIVLTVTAIIASYVGLKGLDTWQRQLKGNTEYDLAKRLLKIVYELREAIAYVRHPFIQYSQEPNLLEEKREGLSQREKEWYAMVQAYGKKWEYVAKAQTDLQTILFEAEAIWGGEIVEKVMYLIKLVNELSFAIQENLEARRPNLDSERFNAEENKRTNEIMLARSPAEAEKDEYKKSLDAVISSIEEHLKSHIQQHYH
jgi:hypothetical protein